jgi:Na+/proline symporter
MPYLEFYDKIVILLYFLFVLAIGLYFRKRASKNLESFILGGRKMPWFLAGISMVATTFAADTPLYVTEVVAKYGISGNWAWFHFLIGGLLTTFLFARLWKRSGVLTEAEFINIRYSGKEAKILRVFKSVYLGFVLNIVIMSWVNLALVKIFVVVFGVDKWDATLITGAVMLLVLFYSAVSGLLGVVYTDFVQFIIAFGGCVILAFLVLQSDKVGGISGLKEALPEGSLDLLPNFDNSLSNSWHLPILSFFAYTGIMWWSSWYPGAEPGGGGYIAQRMMSTKSEKDAYKATLLFQILNYCIRPWPWIIVGLCCVVLYPDLAEVDKGLGFVMAMKDFLPVGLKGLLLVAFLGAYMSTISTQLNWGVGMLVNDAVMPLSKKEISDKKQVYYGRIITVLLAIASMVLVNFIEEIKTVWDFVMQCGAGLGFVLIARWLWWRINAWTEIVATITPFVVYGLNNLILKDHFPSLGREVFEDPSGFMLSVAITIVASLVTIFVTKPTANEKLVSFAEKVRPMGAWNGLVKGEDRNKDLFLSIAIWVFAVIMSYSLLFVIADVLFQNWDVILPKALILLASFAAFAWLSKIYNQKYLAKE